MGAMQPKSDEQQISPNWGMAIFLYVGGNNLRQQFGYLPLKRNDMPAEFASEARSQARIVEAL
jgi:hypothetical protein